MPAVTYFGSSYTVAAEPSWISFQETNLVSCWLVWWGFLFGFVGVFLFIFFLTNIILTLNGISSVGLHCTYGFFYSLGKINLWYSAIDFCVVSQRINLPSCVKIQISVVLLSTEYSVKFFSV